MSCLIFSRGPSIPGLLRLATRAPTTSCDPGPPLVLDLPPTAPLDEAIARLKELHSAYREEYAAYYQRHALPTPRDAWCRSGDRLDPGRGHVLLRKDKQTARVPASSTSTPST